MPPRDLADGDRMSAIIRKTRCLLDTHIGVGSDRARLPLANELNWRWHARPNGDQPQGVRLLTETEVQHLHDDFITRVRRYVAEFGRSEGCKRMLIAYKSWANDTM
eukprot:580509-Pyramimonas_sp.AAC.1